MTTMTLSALHTPGDVIASRYRIVALLGKGGMSETYEAEDLTSYQRVALKVLSLRQMTVWKTLDLFEREAKVLAQLDHPGIPNYLDSFDLDIASSDQANDDENEEQTSTGGDRHFYIVRELVSGESLSDRMAKGWRPTEDELKAISTQILRILIYLHRLSPPLIHRDIKPANIIRQTDGTVFLVDFGTVQDIYRETFLGSNTFVGTAGYMPPEQFRGQTTVASDLYSLGATLLYLATQRTPDQLPQSRMRVDVDACTNLSPSFTQWLSTLLEPIAEDRFPTASQALIALRPPRAYRTAPFPVDQSYAFPALIQPIPEPPTLTTTSGSKRFPKDIGHQDTSHRDTSKLEPLLKESAKILHPYLVSTPSVQSTPLEWPLKPLDAKTIMKRSPQRLHIKIPLCSPKPRQPITLLTWVINPDHFLSVGDGLSKDIVQKVSSFRLLPSLRLLTIGDYFLLGVVILVVLQVVISLLSTIIAIFSVALFQFLSPLHAILLLMVMASKAGETKHTADTFILDITPHQYSICYLSYGNTISTDSGKAQELDIVLANKREASHSAALTPASGCMLIERIAQQYKRHEFGHHLSAAEQDWLVQEIRHFLADIQTDDRDYR